MDYIELLGWVGNVFYVIGVVGIANKNPIRGQYYNCAGGIIYAIFGFLTGSISLMCLSLFLSCVNVYGILNWSKEDS